MLELQSFLVPESDTSFELFRVCLLLLPTQLVLNLRRVRMGLELIFNLVFQSCIYLLLESGWSVFKLIILFLYFYSGFRLAILGWNLHALRMLLLVDNSILLTSMNVCFRYDFSWLRFLAKTVTVNDFLSLDLDGLVFQANRALRDIFNSMSSGLPGLLFFYELCNGSTVGTYLRSFSQLLYFEIFLFFP